MEVFDAGRSGVKLLLAGNWLQEDASPQDRLVDLLAGVRYIDGHRITHARSCRR